MPPPQRELLGALGDYHAYWILNAPMQLLFSWPPEATHNASVSARRGDLAS